MLAGSNCEAQYASKCELDMPSDNLHGRLAIFSSRTTSENPLHSGLSRHIGLPEGKLQEISDGLSTEIGHAGCKTIETWYKTINGPDSEKLCTYNLIMYLCIYIIYTCIYVYIYIYTHTYTYYMIDLHYMYIYIHTYTYTHSDTYEIEELKRKDAVANGMEAIRRQ